MTNTNMLPKDVYQNNELRQYQLFDDKTGRLVYQATRDASPEDMSAIKERGLIVEKPQYFGEWRNTTELAKEKLRTTKIVTEPTKPVYSHAQELKKAEELLRSLIAEAEEYRAKEIAASDALLKALRGDDNAED